MRQLHIYDK